jgi:hypothetical protein
VGHLEEHAGAVARVDLAATGAAVIEVLQDLDRLLEDAVRFVPLDVDHEPDAAGVVLELRVVETLLLGADGGGALRGAHRFGPACRSICVGQGHGEAAAA